jgi:carboxypeptidase Q
VVKGKIVFFNRAFDPRFIETGAAYGNAGDQRFMGPAVAAKLGAAVL